MGVLYVLSVEQTLKRLVGRGKDSGNIVGAMCLSKYY